MGNTISSKQTLFYKDKPVFGFDIGFNTIKVIQTHSDSHGDKIVGYGVTSFDSSSIEEGEVKNYEELARASVELFEKNIIGEINTRRVVATIPANRTFSKVTSLPNNQTKEDFDAAVLSEAEQFIPIPLEELYVDHIVTSIGEENSDVLIVAIPKNIADSYMRFFSVIGLEVCALETTISAASRIISKVENSADIPTILIDLGSLSVDLTVFDNKVVVNGTVPGGGDDFSKRIAEKLSIEKAEANNLKTKYGLGVSKNQTEIREALKPQLDSLIKEIKRVIRYYEEKTEGEQSIGQIITMGGGANMPGLVDYLTDNLRIPTRMCNFWTGFKINQLQPPHEAERSLYVTAAGAAITKPSEIWS